MAEWSDGTFSMSERVILKPGAEVSLGGQRFCIEQILDLETVLAREVDSGQVKPLKVHALAPVRSWLNVTPALTSEPDLESIPDDAWQIARAHFSVIQPLLTSAPCTRTEVSERARSAGVNPATVYRWLQRYQHSGHIAALLPLERSGGRRKSRLDPPVDAVIEATVEEYYLSARKPSVQQTCLEVLRRCRNSDLKPPHPNTVRNRIKQLAEHEKLRRREGGKAVQAKYAPLQGVFPGADRPLAIVQIDHTPVDLILVDDIHRRAVGRPWITLAIDVFSRMVAGFYVSFDPPGTLSVGLCLAHAILPKDTWLAKHDITTPWPIWGVMNVVHADNAKEFRGRMLRKACENYGIDLHWRPVARPHYGGHIERLLGTFNQDIHTLAGTTFSNPAQRGRYDAERQAAMTLAEFERWLSVYIVEVYHQRLHHELTTSPLKRYEAGILGSDEHPGRGLPDRLIDEARLRLDLMPYEKRTVQPYGILLDEIYYYDDSLRPWINAADPDAPKRKRQFIVRRDPRDISVVYFYDPELKQYFTIPYRNTSYPPISLWELREARRRLKEEGQKGINEALIFDAYNRLRALEAQAVNETKKTRRTAQRRRSHAQATRPAPERTPPRTDYPLASADEVEPFDEIEELNG